MTDEDKNVKNRICVVHLHFNSCFFFANSWDYRVACAFLSASPHPNTLSRCFFFFPIKS